MRNPKLLIYGSSYDRGLEHLLKMWPDIKKEVPDAQLRIFYGWELFNVAWKDNPERMAWKEKMNELMKQDGITDLGRISHGALVEEFKNAGVWAYPTHFGEISCITAMRAQALGAVPCVIDYAALQETVRYGVKIKGDIYDKETFDLYKNALIGLLNDEKYQNEVRAEMMPWASEHFAWSNVAEQWNREFNTPSEPIVSLEIKVEEFMEDNQALKAWELVKDTNSPLRERVWLRVKHAFEPEAYKDYYSRALVENPVSEELALDCTKLAPRFALVVPKILELKPKSVIDLGAADGYLCLTLAKRGVKSFGVNLFKPSVDLANARAEKFKLKSKLFCMDLFNYHKKHDVAVMMEVLEHLPDPQKGVDHTMKLLKEGGSAFFSTPRTDHLGVEQHKQDLHDSWDDGQPSGHLRLFTEEEFKDLFKNYKIKDFYTDEQKCMLAEVVLR